MNSLVEEEEEAIELIVVSEGDMAAYGTFEIADTAGIVVIVYSFLELSTGFGHVECATRAL